MDDVNKRERDENGKYSVQCRALDKSSLLVVTIFVRSPETARLTTYPDQYFISILTWRWFVSRCGNSHDVVVAMINEVALKD